MTAVAPDPDRWHRLDALLDEVLDLPAGERTAFVAGIEDADLRDRLARLVAADARGGLLDRPLHDCLTGAGAAVAGGAAEARDPFAPGRLLGPFRIEREIGRGGMGRVFLADRVDGAFEQQVALKVARAGSDEAELIRRFLQERQILARLAHPNIARLVDGGVTPDGWPFFAMEYVDGEPITTYCDRRRMAVDARLALFAMVCEAVRYAHRHLIVHRDLKPSNALVTADGHVKLLDFGIATVLPQDGASAAATRSHWRPLTPEYAAPEQLLGQPITTAADVYALGVLLYELLTGRRPFAFAGLTPAGVGRALDDRDAERPSAVVTRPAADAGTVPDDIARARATRPERLRRRLRGDLDTIVLRALQRDPERRYASVEALIDDLERHRRGFPVRARADGTVYRLGRFVGRHRVGVASAALVLLSLVGGLAGMAWQARIASREAAKAREVTAFLTGIFEQVHPEQARGGTVAARDLVDAGARRVETELAAQPDVQAELRTVLGVAYRELGLWKEADVQLTRALDTRRRLHRGDHPDVADTLTALTHVLVERGDLSRAEATAGEALGMRRRLLGDRHPDVAGVLSYIAGIHQRRGDLDAAVAVAREALEIDRAAYGPDHLEVAQDLNNLGVHLGLRGDYAGAETAHREALRIRRARLDGAHPDVVTSLGNLASAMARRGRLAEAAALDREVVAIRRRLYGPDHPWLALSLNNLAVRLDQLGRFAESEQVHGEAFAIRRAALGEGHSETLGSLNGMAIAAYRRGDLAAAERGFRAARDAWAQSGGENHPLALTAANNLGLILAERGAYPEAEALLRRTLRAREHVHGRVHADVARLLKNLGLVLGRTGRRREAETALREAVATYETVYGQASHPLIAEALAVLADVLVAVRPADAVEAADRALRIRQGAFGDADLRTADARRVLGLALAAAGHPSRAESLLVKSYDVLRTSINPYDRARITNDLAAFYRRIGKAGEAARYEAAGEGDPVPASR